MILRVLFAFLAISFLIIVNVIVQHSPDGKCWLRQRVGDSCLIMPLPVRKY